MNTFPVKYVNPVDGKSTGRLSKSGDLMEVMCVVTDAAGNNLNGTRWTAITKEDRERILNGRVTGAANYAMSAEDLQRTFHSFAPGGEPRLVTGLSVESYSLTADGMGLRGFADALNKIAPDGLRCEVSIDGCGVFSISDAHVAQLIQDAGGPPGATMRKSQFNLRQVAQELSIPYDRLHDVFRMYVAEKLPPLKKEPTVTAETKTPAESVPEHSGHNVNYYSVEIKHPKRPERAPYTFEAEDLIQALNLNFHEGTVLKSLVRAATARELGLLKQGGDEIRDAEKMVHSSSELLRARKLSAGK